MHIALRKFVPVSATEEAFLLMHSSYRESSGPSRSLPVARHHVRVARHHVSHLKDCRQRCQSFKILSTRSHRTSSAKCQNLLSPCRQGPLYELTSSMAHWFPFAQPYFQPQPQPQLGLYPDATYGCVPHPACLVPSQPPAAYAYGSTPMGMQPVSHVWIPFKLVPEGLPYPNAVSQLQSQQSYGQQLPYMEAQRMPASRPAPHYASDHDLQMAWPDSPLTAHRNAQLQGQTNTQLQGRSAEWATYPSVHDSCLPSSDSPTPSQTQAHQAALSTQLSHLHISNRATAAASASQRVIPPSKSEANAPHCTPAPLSDTSDSLGPAYSSSVSDQDTQSGVGLSSTAQRLVAEAEEDVGAEPGSSAWQWLTEALLKDVMSQLPQHCRKRCRLVCKRWRGMMDLHIQVKYCLDVVTTHMPRYCALQQDVLTQNYRCNQNALLCSRLQCIYGLTIFIWRVLFQKTSVTQP